MSEFKIERGVEMMPANVGTKGQTKYPFAKMKTGDSFHVGNASLQAIHGAISYFHKTHPECAKWKFATRKDGEGRRVWRIA